jgi:hypothetical protein
MTTLRARARQESIINGVDYGSQDTTKLAKIIVSHEAIRDLLGLPEDVIVTSMHTTRGEPSTGIYLLCERFDSVSVGGTAPEITVEDAKTIGLWDTREN